MCTNKTISYLKFVYCSNIKIVVLLKIAVRLDSYYKNYKINFTLHISLCAGPLIEMEMACKSLYFLLNKLLK